MENKSLMPKHLSQKKKLETLSFVLIVSILLLFGNLSLYAFSTVDLSLEV